LQHTYTQRIWLAVVQLALVVFSYLARVSLEVQENVRVKPDLSEAFAWIN
jgi:hypothetical protein